MQRMQSQPAVSVSGSQAAAGSPGDAAGTLVRSQRCRGGRQQGSGTSAPAGATAATAPMPTVRPLTQACAYEGYGGERARRGEDNQCLADKNIRTEKGWKKTATVIKAVKVALDAAGFKAPAASQQPASQQ
jgi:hypothetical protein